MTSAVRRSAALFVCLVFGVSAAGCGSSEDGAGSAPSPGTTTLAGLMAIAGRPCSVVDASTTANCGNLGLQHGYSAATWLTVLSRDPANAGKVVVYGEDWAAWGTAEEVAPYSAAGGTSQQL